MASAPIPSSTTVFATGSSGALFGSHASQLPQPPRSITVVPAQAQQVLLVDAANPAPPIPQPSPPAFLVKPADPPQAEPRRQVIPLEIAGEAAVAAACPSSATGGGGGRVAAAHGAAPTGESQTPQPQPQKEQEQRMRDAKQVSSSPVDASHLKAQVRMLEDEVKILREGLARTATAAASSLTPALESCEQQRGQRLQQSARKSRRSASSPAAAAAAAGRPEIAFGRRVQPSTSTTARSTLTRMVGPSPLPKRKAKRQAVSPAIVAGGTAGSVEPLQPEAVPVPVWEGGRELPLQGSAAGGTLLPEPWKPVVAGRHYWLSADPMHLATTHGSSTTATVPAGPSPSAAAVTVVQLSPSASVDSAAAARQQHQQRIVSALQEQPQQDDRVVTAAAEAVGIQHQELDLATAQREVAAQKERIAQQEHSLRAMAFALLEMEHRLSLSTKPAASPPAPRSAAPAPAALAGPQAGAECTSETAREQQQAMILALALQLAQAQRSEEEERGRRVAAETALQSSRSDVKKLQSALETLRNEHERAIGVTAVAQETPQGGVAALSAPATSDEAAVVADLRQQVEQLTRKLRAWERWYFTLRPQDTNREQVKREPKKNAEQQDDCCHCQHQQQHHAAENRAHVTDVPAPHKGTHECCIHSRVLPLAYSSMYQDDLSPIHPPSSTAGQCATGKPATALDGHRENATADAAVDPLAYLRSWRRYLPTTTATADKESSGDGGGHSVSGKACPTPAAAPAPSGGPLSKETEVKADKQEETSAAVRLSRAYEDTHDELVAFLAKERALRELAAAEREVAEERLRKLLRADAEDSERESGGPQCAPTAAAADLENGETPLRITNAVVAGSACTP